MRDLLPAGHHLSVTWSVTDNYGGMTNAMFHRARAFVTEATTPVDVLTFDWRSSYDPVRHVLRDRGVLIDGVRLRNMWEELANADPDQLREAGDGDYPHFAPLTLAGDTATANAVLDGAHTTRKVRFARDKKTVLQRDYFREDGSLFASDRCDIGANEIAGVRSIHLCDQTGAPIREFGTATSLYHFWVDLITNGKPSYLIVDSKYAANFIASYRRDHAVTCYVAHGSHLSAKYDTPYSPLTASRGDVFRALERYDAIVLLTERQRQDVRVRLGDMGNLHVVPNSHRYTNTGAAEIERDPHRGAMLVSLTARKQVDHAIRALAGAPGDVPRNLEVHVYGEGGERKHLQALIDSSGLRDSFFLDGFTDTPMREFQRASFSLLTSSAEGFPLVLLESMMTGCIPIAYDMRYGPSQIIDHGVNGYLVPPGDVEGLRRCITEFLALPEPDKEAMRAAAMKRAAAFADSAIIPRWGEVLSAGRDRKQRNPEPARLDVEGASVALAPGHVTVDCDVTVSPESDISEDRMAPIAVAFRGRRGSSFLRSNATSISRHHDGRLRVGVRFPNEAFDHLGRTTLDVTIDAWIGGHFVTERIPSSDLLTRYAPYTTAHGNLSFERCGAAPAKGSRRRSGPTRFLTAPITTSRTIWRRRLRPLIVATAATRPWLKALLSRTRRLATTPKRR
jgi:poly(glycerol-phosphate) alpha-glucosyltransferase